MSESNLFTAFLAIGVGTLLVVELLSLLWEDKRD